MSFKNVNDGDSTMTVASFALKQLENHGRHNGGSHSPHLHCSVLKGSANPAYSSDQNSAL